LPRTPNNTPPQTKQSNNQQTNQSKHTHTTQTPLFYAPDIGEPRTFSRLGRQQFVSVASGGDLNISNFL